MASKTKSTKIATPVKSKPSGKDAGTKKPAVKPDSLGKTGTQKLADAHANRLSAAYIDTQHKKLLDLRDSLMDQMQDVAQGNLRDAGELGSGAAYGQHMGDAGSDSYEKDFALSILSQEQDSLYEIEEAIKRIEAGTYGICEKSGLSIPKNRLDAIPWARYTLECQAELEKQLKGRRRWESTRQFVDPNETSEEEEEEEVDDELRANKNTKET
jgi:RNA polymerase-binding transcription factor DksA